MIGKANTLDEEPTLSRQEELKIAYQANISSGSPPYANIKIASCGELIWIMRQHSWSGQRLLPKGKKRANLRRAILRQVDLSGIYLYEADLSYARMGKVDLTNAHLGGANLTHADMVEATLYNTDLAYAKLVNTRLYRAKVKNARFGGAILTNANLCEMDASGADFRRADLCGADLRETKMDTGTLLANVKINDQTSLGDVIWNGAALMRVSWDQAARLGDEHTIAQAKTRQEYVKAYRDAARAYRGLVMALTSQGLTGIASGYRLREQRLERKALYAEQKVLSWFFSWLLDLLSGYGERPRRPFIAYIIIVLAFTGIYYGIGHIPQVMPHPLSLDEALVLSLTSFHGRGFLPTYSNLGDWVARTAAVEAVVGLFIELIFIATFSRRFLGS